MSFIQDSNGSLRAARDFAALCDVSELDLSFARTILPEAGTLLLQLFGRGDLPHQELASLAFKKAGPTIANGGAPSRGKFAWSMVEYWAPVALPGFPVDLTPFDVPEKTPIFVICQGAPFSMYKILRVCEMMIRLPSAITRCANSIDRFSSTDDGSKPGDLINKAETTSILSRSDRAVRKYVSDGRLTSYATTGIRFSKRVLKKGTSRIAETSGHEVYHSKIDH